MLPLDEAKASIRKVREAGKTISNRSILNEIRDRDLFTPPDKKTRKERQKEEQAQLPTQKKTIVTQTVDEIEEEEAIPVTTEVPKPAFLTQKAIAYYRNLTRSRFDSSIHASYQTTVCWNEFQPASESIRL